MRFSNDWQSLCFNQIVELYDSVGWENYTNDIAALRSAFERSTFVLAALSGEQLIGIARSISDEVSIHYLQDLLIRPNFQRQGVGAKLIARTMERFKRVRNHVLLTDDREHQVAFYKSMGFSNTSEKNSRLNAFVKLPKH